MEGQSFTKDDEIDIFFEFSDQEGISPASLDENLDKIKAQSVKAMNLAMGVIRQTAYKIHQAIAEIDRDTRPSAIEIEFSIKLDLEAGSIIPMVAKTTTGGQFNIKFIWDLERPKQASIIINDNK